MTEETKQKYLVLAKDHTTEELSRMMAVTISSIRRYSRITGIKPKPSKHSNLTTQQWVEKFEKQYIGRLVLVGDVKKTSNGHLKSKCKCMKCNTEWTIQLQEKIRTNTGCIKCDKGHYGNLYTKEQVAAMLNSQYEGQWQLIEYGHYSKKDSLIRCTLCGAEHTVKLSDFICTTTMRCTKCQTGSFGEYIIATTLAYNGIEFEREKRIDVNGHRYRLDFLVAQTIGIEYSGIQHFEKDTLYYNEDVNKGVDLKKKWCLDNGFQFKELKAVYDIDKIIKMLSNAIGKELTKPDPEFFRRTNPDINAVLDYMRTHSSRQTMKDLNIPVTKLRKYVMLSGYASISAWQAENSIKA